MAGLKIKHARSGPARVLTATVVSARMALLACPKPRLSSFFSMVRTHQWLVRARILRFWVFHETLTAGGLELICRNCAVAIDVNHFKVDDVRHGLILRDGCAIW